MWRIKESGVTTGFQVTVLFCFIKSASETLWPNGFIYCIYLKDSMTAHLREHNQWVSLSNKSTKY